ncbi:unnamed protein product [Symbiodinium microadriaticum]|nr:unnamed protein product [Symbiodinium microadriaticum]
MSLNQVPQSARRGRTQAAAKPTAAEPDKAPSAERRGRRKEASPKPVLADESEQAPLSARRGHAQAPSKLAAATSKGKAVPKQFDKECDKVASPKRSRSPVKKAPGRPAPRNRMEEPHGSALDKGAAATTQSAAKGKLPEPRGKPTLAPKKLQASAPELYRKPNPALTELPRVSRALPPPLAPRDAPDNRRGQPLASKVKATTKETRERSRTCPKSPRLESSPTPFAAVCAAREGDAKVQAPSATGLLDRLRRTSQAAAPIAALPTSPRRAHAARAAPAVDTAEAPEPAGSEASEASDLTAELQAQEEAASRQFQQMETSAKNAWQQAKAMADVLAQQKQQEARQADAKKRLAEATASRQAAEARVQEVELAVESLRGEIAQVEEESQQRIASLQREAEEASRQKETCLVEALATAQGAKEDAQRHLQPGVTLEMASNSSLPHLETRFPHHDDVEVPLSGPLQLRIACLPLESRKTWKEVVSDSPKWRGQHFVLRGNFKTGGANPVTAKARVKKDAWATQVEGPGKKETCFEALSSWRSGCENCGVMRWLSPEPARSPALDALVLDPLCPSCTQHASLMRRAGSTELSFLCFSPPPELLLRLLLLLVASRTPKVEVVVMVVKQC